MTGVTAPVRRALLTHLALPLALAAALAAQSARDPLINERIRQEIGTRSEIMRTLHYFTDVYGPRLTGSPNAKAAAEWAVKTMASWGFENSHLEPWDFRHAGWANEYAAAHIVAPVKDQLTIEVVAWTPGTQGIVRAPAFALAIPERPTQAELSAYLDSVASQVRGKIVLASRPAFVAVTLTPRPARQDDERLRAVYDPNAPPAAPPAAAPRTNPPPMTAGQISRRVDEFLLARGALVRVNDAGREHGQIVAFNNPTYDVTTAVPTVVMRNEDYGRVSRLLADGTSVMLEFNIVNTVYPEGKTAYNAIAEIPGTDKKAEVVMLGGHLDSWQSATGATDNAIGCAVMMEAARVLKVLGVQPRRTIRVALWSGEEQGLLGSQAYIRRHFGSAEEPLPDHGRLSAYLNLDGGTGRTRGATVFGPPAAAAVIREALAPFQDLGVLGASATTRRTIGSTDSSSFNAAGLPGINFMQDPIQYDAATHHTNLDTYERILEEDAKTSAIVIAGTLYELAMRDDLLPRFDKKTMPAGSWR
jgi:hypothetical protein